MIDKKKLAEAMSNSNSSAQLNTTTDSNVAAKPIQAKDVDPNATLEVKNPEVEELMAVYKNENTPDNLNKLIVAAREARFLMPANINDKKQPIPVFIKNDDGQLFLPIYTNKEHIAKAPKSPAIMNFPFLGIIQMSLNPSVKVAGIVFNPFTDNLIFKDKLVERIAEVEKARMAAKKAAEEGGQAEGKVKTIKMDAKQYAAFERKRFESIFFPTKFFAEGKSFVDELVDKKEEYIDTLYEESYQNKRMYPYLSEEFSVMALSISEDFLVVRVDFQDRDKTIGCSERAYLTWDKTKEEGHYFLIELAMENKVVLAEVDAEHKHHVHGEAPAEGAELQVIIDIAKGTNKITS